MRQYFLFSISIILLAFLTNCNSIEKKIEDIANAESELLEVANDKEIAASQTEQLITMYEGFANDYPEDSLAPFYLFKAAELFRSTGSPTKAIDLYDSIRDEYEDFEKRPHCLFLKAFTYENEIGNAAQAKLHYQEFLQQYPNHELAESVEFSLQFLGLTPEEIVKQFEKNKPKNIDTTSSGGN